MVEIDRTMTIGVYDTIGGAYTSLGDGWSSIEDVKQHVDEETGIREYTIVHELTFIQDG